MILRFFFLGTACFVLGCAFVALTNWWIVRQSRPRIAGTVDAMAARDIAVVLGTAPTFRGNPNPFFLNRMDAAATLFHAGKVRHLLVTGDNGTRGYDEPTAMRDALVQRGVPEDAITLDYAGFRTLDSMARAKAIFGVERCIVVTDDFHIARSIYLAAAHGIDAIGCASKPVPWEWSKKTRIREVASRAAAWLDIWVLRTKPRFYGPKEPIRIAAAERP